MKTEKQLKLKKDINSNLSNKRELIKRNLIRKYGISDDQAERILRQYEDKRGIANFSSDNESADAEEVSFDEPPSQQHNGSENDVDEIIGDIIPDYNKKISIELKNVNLTFDLDAEQVDTIKEKVIMKIKRKKSEKRNCMF